MSIETDVQRLEPGSVVRLYELDGSAIGFGALRFHGHNRNGTIVLAGVAYSPWPLTADGFVRSTDRPASPTLTLANLDGSITALCNMYEDLVGAKLIVRATLAKYLDARNWDGPELAVNSGFDTGLTGWTLAVGSGGSASVTNGIANIVSSTIDNTLVRQVVPTTIGKTYRIRYSRTAGGSTAVYTSVSNGPFTGASPGVYEYTVVATASTLSVGIHGTGALSTASLDYVSIHEVGANPTADPNERMPEEVFFVERKVSESREAIRFELASAMNFEGVQIPRRQIVPNRCLWLTIGGYRGPYCGYVGGPVARADNTATSNPSEDRCGGLVSSCKLRFGANSPLPYGGFPAAGLARS